MAGKKVSKKTETDKKSIVKKNPSLAKKTVIKKQRFPVPVLPMRILSLVEGKI